MKRKQKPRLLNRHKETRLTFAMRYQTCDEKWDKDLFSDENKFNHDGPDGLQYYWHDPKIESDSFSARVSGGGGE